MARDACISLCAALLRVVCRGAWWRVGEGTWQEGGPETLLSSNELSEESAAPFRIYLGSGCFWARQKDIAKLEQGQAFIHRALDKVTAQSGYAGATRTGPGGLVCYHGGPDGTLYSDLGYAEVVSVQVDPPPRQGPQMRALLQQFFTKEFTHGADGEVRLDPQDVGLAYRSVIGLPGGMSSPLMHLVREGNVNGMQLKEGKGGDADVANTVYVYDTAKFAFHRAERYHQFWHGPPKCKLAQEKLGHIAPTGCPEEGHSASFRTV